MLSYIKILILILKIDMYMIFQSRYTMVNMTRRAKELIYKKVGRIVYLEKLIYILEVYIRGFIYRKIITNVKLCKKINTNIKMLIYIWYLIVDI